MKYKNLFEIMQNSAISAIALHSFVLGYFNTAKGRSAEKSYPTLVEIFYVLPVVYNEDAMKTFGTSNQLYTAIINNRSINLGLQERANKMAAQTFDALNLSFSKSIMTYNAVEKTIELCKGFKSARLPLPLVMNTDESRIKSICDSAFKLGAIFAKGNKKNIQIQLNIRF